MNPRRAAAADKASVNPVRSASKGSAALPAWATTPVPCPVTDNPADHAVLFTHQVPYRWTTCSVGRPSISLQDRHLDASRGCVKPLNSDRASLMPHPVWPVEKF